MAQHQPVRHTGRHEIARVVLQLGQLLDGSQTILGHLLGALQDRIVLGERPDRVGLPNRCNDTVAIAVVGVGVVVIGVGRGGGGVDGRRGVDRGGGGRCVVFSVFVAAAVLGKGGFLHAHHNDIKGIASLL